MTNQKEIISTINDLIETLKDGQKGFKEAADAVGNPELKSLFAEYSQQRSRFASELQMQAKSFGESEPETEGSTAGAVHRGWINLKSAITSKEESAILAECERGEDAAKAAYEAALQKNLPVDVRTLVDRQYQGVEANHDRVRNLRNAAA